MVLDHGGDGRISHEWRTERSEPETTPTALLDQVQRHRRTQQPQCGILGEPQLRRQSRQGLGLLRQHVEQSQTDAGQQHLRIHEPGHQIEQPARTSLRYRACQREGCRPAPETPASDQTVTPAEPAVFQSVEQGRVRFQQRLRLGPAERAHAATRTTSSAIALGTSRSASNRTSARIWTAPGHGGMASMAAATRRSK